MNVVVSCIRITAEHLPQQDNDNQIKEHHGKEHLYKLAYQSYSLSTMAGNVYSQQLQGHNGLVSFAILTLRSSLMGAGLYTYTPIMDYNIKNNQNTSLLGGFQVPFHVLNQLVSSCK